MDTCLKNIAETFYKNISITDFNPEKESEKYSASRFLLGNKRIIYRKAYITPKKIGQFVTCWKRNNEGITHPFETTDLFDFYIITVKNEQKLGQFIFPKSVLISKGIVSKGNKSGKRGFRVYPKWDIPKNKQATKTQEWQLKYFLELNTLEENKLRNLLQLNN